MEEETFCQCGEKIHPLGPAAWADDQKRVYCRSAEHIPERAPEIINRSSTDRRYTSDGRYVAENKYDSTREHCVNCGIKIGLINDQWNNSLSGYICQYRRHTPVDSKLALIP